MKIVDNEKFAGTTYHGDMIVCDGCKRKFCHTVRAQEDGEKFCKSCFNHRFGTEDMKIVEKKLDDIGNYLWETPITEISPEMKKKLNWVKPSNANL